MRPRHVPRPRRETVRAEHLSANGADQLFLPMAADAINQLREEMPPEFWRKCSGQVKTSGERFIAVRYN